MTNRRRNWLVGLGLAALFVLGALIIGARMLANRFEPYIRQQAIEYLQKRFDSDVELASLSVDIPKIPTLKLATSRGRGVFAYVEGQGISMRYRGSEDTRPMFRMKRFSFLVDLGTLFETQKIVHSVTIDGMEINVPPKGQRPRLDTDDSDHAKTSVLIEEVLISNSVLRIIPKEKGKKPLQFDLHRVKLESAGKDAAMKYDATLTNAMPPGEIQSKGTFGPWVATEPGDTPLAGEYDFKNADLGVFDAIAGILHSTGQFEGSLDSISVKGQATVPNFSLKSSFIL